MQDTEVHDLSDEGQCADVCRRLGIGKSSDARVLSALERARRGRRRDGTAAKPKADALNDTNIITGAGRNSGGGLAATAVSSIVGGTFFSQASLGVYDFDSGTTLAESFVGPVIEEGRFLPISVNAPPSPTGGPLKIILTVLYQRTQGTTPVALTVTEVVQELAVGAPVVLQPLLSANPEPPMRIGLATGRPRPSLDYWYDEKARPRLTLRLPFVGAQRFASRVLTPVFANDAVAEIYLFSTAKGGAIRANAKTRNALKRNVSANGSLLTWMLNWNGKSSQDRSAQFGRSAFIKDASMIGLFMLGVKTETSGENLVWTSIGGPAPGAAASGIHPLPDITYIWR
jgi:hypothetical protein